MFLRFWQFQAPAGSILYGPCFLLFLSSEQPEISRSILGGSQQPVDLPGAPECCMQLNFQSLCLNSAGSIFFSVGRGHFDRFRFLETPFYPRYPLSDAAFYEPRVAEKGRITEPFIIGDLVNGNDVISPTTLLNTGLRDWCIYREQFYCDERRNICIVIYIWPMFTKQSIIKNTKRASPIINKTTSI